MDEVSRKYQCQICMNVIRDARLAACCGQHYCDSCLTRWLSGTGRKRTCPHCRKGGFQSVINKEKNREIEELRIRCTSRGKGCTWVGALGSLQNHRQSDNGCGYEEVECPNKGIEYSDTDGLWHERKCGKKMERRYIRRHKEYKCSYREYMCEHCGCINTYDAIAGTGRKRKSRQRTADQSLVEQCFLSAMMAGLQVVNFRAPAPTGNHYAICDDFPLTCPNECGMRDIKRKEKGTHLEVCPLQTIDCPYKDAGCTHQVPRKDMESHIESSTQEHLLMVFKSFQELKTRVK